MNDIKQLLLDKLEASETLNQNYAKVFNGELKKILKYIQDLEEIVRRDNR